MILLRLIGVLLDLLLLPLRLLRRSALVPRDVWLTLTVDGPVVDIIGRSRFWQLARTHPRACAGRRQAGPRPPAARWRYERGLRSIRRQQDDPRTGDAARSSRLSIGLALLEAHPRSRRHRASGLRVW